VFRCVQKGVNDLTVYTVRMTSLCKGEDHLIENVTLVCCVPMSLSCN
jgi:hypothetical protein